VSFPLPLRFFPNRGIWVVLPWSDAFNMPFSPSELFVLVKVALAIDVFLSSLFSYALLKDGSPRRLLLLRSFLPPFSDDPHFSRVFSHWVPIQFTPPFAWTKVVISPFPFIRLAPIPGCLLVDPQALSFFSPQQFPMEDSILPYFFYLLQSRFSRTYPFSCP